MTVGGPTGAFTTRPGACPSGARAVGVHRAAACTSTCCGAHYELTSQLQGPRRAAAHRATLVWWAYVLCMLIYCYSGRAGAAATAN